MSIGSIWLTCPFPLKVKNHEEDKDGGGVEGGALPAVPRWEVRIAESTGLAQAALSVKASVEL